MNPYARVDAVLLALDPAKGKSGAALLRPLGLQFKLVMGMIVLHQSERESFVAGAVELARTVELPLIVVAEEWDPPRGSGASRVDKRWNYPTILGIGEGWGRWTAEFERAGISEKDVVRVTPNVWRDALYGKDRPKTSDALKQLSIAYVARRLNAHLPHDVAEAACLGLWGIHSMEVLKRADAWFKKRRKTPA